MKKIFTFVAAAFMALTMNAELPQYEVADAIAAHTAQTIKDGDSIAIRGVVTKMELKGKNFSQYGSVCIYVADATDAEGTWEHYNCLSLDKAKFTATDPAYDATSTAWAQFNKIVDANGVEIYLGDTIIAEGKAKKYNSTYELDQNCYLTNIVAGPREMPEEEVLDTLSVAEAIATTMALDSAATSEKEYVVEGYVVNAQDFSWGSLQQLFFMADDAENTGNQVFEAYFCTAKKDGEAIPVLNGDKIYLKGKLTKYWDKNAATPAFLPEVKNGTAEFISMVEGDRSKPEAENISVADALEIGKDVASGSTSEEVYNIVGYVTAMAGKNADGGWAQFGNQMFWIADVMDTTLHSNEAGAFEVYQGVADQEVKVGYKISVYTKVKNYNGLLESETKAPVTIIEGARIDTITAGDAIAIALALEDNKTTEETYVVQGYVKKIKEAYNAQFGNVTFYLADAMDSQEDVNVYRGKISAEEGAALAEGDFVAVVGKLTNNYYNNKNSARMNDSEVFVRWKTAIENVLMNNPKINKVIVDGVVYIVREGKMYNMQGVQVR